MIGSTIGQMATADKLTVEQIQESIQNGTLPAYIGIPLMQQKMEAGKRMQQAQAQPPSGPPIAQQIMQDADMVVNPQVPMYQGVDNLPSNLPTEGMRGGGIVALAEGGETEDLYPEEEDTRVEDEEYTQAMRGLSLAQAQMGAMGSPDKMMMGKLNTTPNVESFAPNQQQTQQTPQASKNPQISQGMQGGDNGIDGLIEGAANRYNLPPELMRNVASAESSGQSQAKNPNSSAKGVYQFIDSTWAGLGGTPGGQFNPEENVELGAKYLRQNAETLKRELGRDPSYSEVYAAHYFGPGVAKMLANASPKDSINDGLRTFNSPSAVNQILKANPNLQGKTVGQVLASLEGKAGSGIVQLARGGAISLAEGGDFTDQYGNFSQPPANSSTTPLGRFLGSNAEGYQVEQPPERSFYDSMMDSFRASPIGGFMSQTDEERKAAQDRMNEASSIKLRTPEEVQAGEKSKQSNINIPTAKEPPKVTAPVVTGKTPEQKAQEEKALKDSNIETPNVDQEKPTAKASTEKTLYDEFLADYKDTKSDRERQKKMDAYLALATAGFATAGGGSQNALQNISQGALAGLSQFSGSRKAAQAAQAADTRNLLTAQRYKELGDASAATQAMAEVRLTQEEKLRTQSMVNARDKELQDALQKDISLIGKPAEVQTQALNKLRVNDPQYNALFKQVYGLSYGDYLKQSSGKQPGQSTSGFRLLNP
jgi:hypothetical protein